MPEGNGIPVRSGPWPAQNMDSVTPGPLGAEPLAESDGNLPVHGRFTTVTSSEGREGRSRKGGKLRSLAVCARRQTQATLYHWHDNAGDAANRLV